jgi:hypothetical protein
MTAPTSITPRQQRQLAHRDLIGVLLCLSAEAHQDATKELRLRDEGEPHSEWLRGYEQGKATVFALAAQWVTELPV